MAGYGRGKSYKSDAQKDNMRAGQLMARLERFATLTPADEGYEKAQMTAAQVNATQIMLKKLIPDLQAIEQTNIDPRDEMSEEQIFAQLKQLIESSPEMAGKLRQLLIPTEVPIYKVA